ncbi:hypothetical protein BDZ91DRAFT_786016 [Kalaharituber pfeilii]|nr:hypothetical protein BDZ91DRAFT_786016 [Kalaharituber pfeilii]
MPRAPKKSTPVGRIPKSSNTELEGSPQPDLVSPVAVRIETPDTDRYKMWTEDSSAFETPCKRPRTSSGAKESGVKELIPMLSQLKWVHPDMKGDTEVAFTATSAELVGCVNFYVRVSMWKKREITKVDRDHFVQAAFGVSSFQLNLSEADGDSKKINEPIGIIVARQIGLYAKSVLRKLRMHFEALLRMFLECEEANAIVSSILFQIKARGSESIRLEHPCVDPTEVKNIFIKDNLRLVCDVWHPIIDVVETDYLLINPMWAERFVRATCEALAWLITYFFRCERAEEQRSFELGRCPVNAEQITACIFKGDLAMIPEWPLIRKPMKWSQRKGASTVYGALKHVKIQRDLAESFVDDDIDREIRHPESGITVPKAPQGMREMFECESMYTQADWVVSVLQARAQAMRSLQTETMRTAKALEEKSEALLDFMKQHKLNMEGAALNKMREMNAERFLVEAKKLFIEAESRECAPAHLGRVPAQMISTTEIWGGFAAWVGLCKKEGYFGQLVNAYDTGLMVGSSGVMNPMMGNFAGGYMGEMGMGRDGNYLGHMGMHSMQNINATHMQGNGQTGIGNQMMNNMGGMLGSHQMGGVHMNAHHLGMQQMNANGTVGGHMGGQQLGMHQIGGQQMRGQQIGGQQMGGQQMGGPQMGGQQQIGNGAQNQLQMGNQQQIGNAAQMANQNMNMGNQVMTNSQMGLGNQMMGMGNQMMGMGNQGMGNQQIGMGQIGIGQIGIGAQGWRMMGSMYPGRRVLPGLQGFGDMHTANLGSGNGIGIGECHHGIGDKNGGGIGTNIGGGVAALGSGGNVGSGNGGETGAMAPGMMGPPARPAMREVGCHNEQGGRTSDTGGKRTGEEGVGPEKSMEKIGMSVLGGDINSPCGEGENCREGSVPDKMVEGN